MTGVFELAQSSGQWTETRLVNFSGPDGIGPQAGLIADKAGNLYGMVGEATTSYGTVYELSKATGTWTESVRYQFKGGIERRWREPYR